MTFEYLVGIISGLILSAVSVVIAYFIKRGLDNAMDSRIHIVTKMRCFWSAELQKSIGCPGIIVKFINEGERPVHIQKVQLRVTNMRNFGWSTEGGESKPLFPDNATLTLGEKLFRLPDPHDENPATLERYDVIEYFLPIVFLGIRSCAGKMPSEYVSIVAILTDGEELTVLQGLEIQDQARHLFQEFTDSYSSNPNLPKDIQLFATYPKPLQLETSRD